MEPASSELRDLRRLNVLRRWPRFRWDSFGRSRLQVWTTSFLGLAFGLSALFPSIFLELYLRGEKLESFPFSAFAATTGGRIALVGIALLGAWITDRLFAAQTKPEARPVLWLRILRFILLTIPYLGILVSLVLLKSMPERRGQKGYPHLDLERPFRFSFAGALRRLDHFLLASSQSIWGFALWISLFQGLPLFAMIGGLGRIALAGSASRMSILFLCVLLRIGAAGAFLVFARERSRELQLSRRETAAALVVLLATLLPLPWSLAGLMAVLYLSSSKLLAPETTSFATIYKKHFGGRALLAVTPIPLVAEIYGDTERRRSRFYALKAGLLGLEITALAWLLAPWSGAASLSVTSWTRIIALSPCAAVPGLLLWMVGIAARLLRRWPRLGTLASTPHATMYALVPLVVVQAFIAGSLAGLGYREALAAFLDMLRLESLGLGALIGLLRVVTSLFTRAPTPWLADMVLGTTLSFFFLLMGATFGVPVPGMYLLRMGQHLCPLAFLGSPLSGFLFGRWLLHPFRFRDLFDHRLSGHVRLTLVSFAGPAVLPLGGLAVPVWIHLRHVRGAQLDRESARLRGYD